MELRTLVDLQQLDTRIAGLEADVARLPGEIEAIHTRLAEARKSVDAARHQLETARKSLRGKERDLDDVSVKRQKSEGRLYEVKTNTEYSAALREIEEIKRQKAVIEEEMLALMELGERLTVEVRSAEARFGGHEEEARREEATVRERLTAAETELEAVRGERASLARELPRPLLADYEKILRARSGVAVALVGSTGVCGGCRVTIRPQVLMELRAASNVLHCESCGRFLVWQDSA